MEAGSDRGIAEWRPAAVADLAAIQKIADAIHADLPERPEIYAEKLELFPEGCFVLAQNESVVGYCLSHPWLLSNIPALDQFLTTLPSLPNCLLIHDVAVLQQARGHGAVNALIELILKLARKRGFQSLALISVYDTYPFWARFGFEVITDFALSDKLKPYGESARYMLRRLM
jgi:ribosomal protein S18 acetylase RimI-like enzyme